MVSNRRQHEWLALSLDLILFGLQSLLDNFDGLKPFDTQNLASFLSLQLRLDGQRIAQGDKESRNSRKRSDRSHESYSS